MHIDAEDLTAAHERSGEIRHQLVLRAEWERQQAIQAWFDQLLHPAWLRTAWRMAKNPGHSRHTPGPLRDVISVDCHTTAGSGRRPWVPR